MHRYQNIKRMLVWMVVQQTFQFLFKFIRLLLAQWSWRFFNFVNEYSLFSRCPPLKKCGVLHLNKIESPILPNVAFCNVLPNKEHSTLKNEVHVCNVCLPFAILVTKSYMAEILTIRCKTLSNQLIIL